MTAGELKAKLKALGWSQVKAAKKLGLSESAISRYLSGQRPIPGVVQVALRRW